MFPRPARFAILVGLVADSIGRDRILAPSLIIFRVFCLRVDSWAALDPWLQLCVFAIGLVGRVYVLRCVCPYPTSVNWWLDVARVTPFQWAGFRIVVVL